MSCCNTLHHNVKHCNTLQHAATHCNTLTLTINLMLQHTATLQRTATHSSTLLHTAAHCNTLQHTATHCSTLQHTATHCNTLQHTGVWNPCRTNALHECVMLPKFVVLTLYDRASAHSLVQFRWCHFGGIAKETGSMTERQPSLFCNSTGAISLVELQKRLGLW